MHTQTHSFAPARIERLPDELVNQIAAGEVVERPASVLKECIENSLDAGATKISIQLSNGGMQEITIVDNGHGIAKEDLPLSLERHATSKIRREADLQAIHSFGFRGEALASIASVANLEIKSRTADNNEGYSIHSALGLESEVKPIGCPIGTTITVRELFEKIPARKKFLKSAATEFAYCAKQVKELALANPQCTFFLEHSGRKIASYTGATRLQRFKECLKPSWEPLLVEDSRDGLRMQALLSPAELLQENGELHLFINGRVVKSRVFLAAIRNAYQEVLGNHHEPSGCLYLEIDGNWVDVNVHPQKLEVRCLHQDRIYAWILANVRKALPPPTPQFKIKEETPAEGLIGTRVLSAGTAQVLKSGLAMGSTNEAVFFFNPNKLHQAKLLQKWEHEKATEGLPVPLVLSLGQEQFQVLQGNATLLFTLGFEIDSYGSYDVVVKTKPIGLPDAVIPQALKALAALLVSDKNTPMKRLMETVAEHLSPPEMGNSVFSLESSDLELTWGGLSIYFQLPFSQIESKIR